MNNETTSIPPRNRLYLGGFIFITGFAAPLLIPLVTASDLSAEWKTIVSGLLALGIPELFMLIAAGILGKQGFAYLKTRLWRMVEPPATVSPLRYRLGLVLLLAPILFIWLQPYLEQAEPGLADRRVMLGMISHGLIASSLFVLGGEFWDKLRGLFVYNARVVQPPGPTVTASDQTTQAAISPPLPRLYTGGLLFGLSLTLPLFIPLIVYAPVSEDLRLAISGLMLFGIPQLLMLLAVAILGKPGFAYLKQRLGGLLRLILRGLLAAGVSRRRYRLGTLLLAIPLLLGVVWPYLISLSGSLDGYKYEIAIAGDVILVLAIIVLGSGFWEKFIGLFQHQSRVSGF